MLLSGFLFTMPVKDTVWWQTPGGTVTEHRSPTDTSCSLMLYDEDGSVTFEWNDPNRVFVTAIDWDWQFPDNWRVPVAMRLGEVWLSAHGNSAVIEAVGHGNSVAFATDQAVDELLLPANRIDVRTTDKEMSIKLQSSKVEVLLSRMRKCRDSIRK